MQGIFLPVMAIAFAAAPVAGQNFGARQPERVRETFRAAVKLCTALMFVLMLLCQWRPDVLIGFFSKEPEVIDDRLAVPAHHLVELRAVRRHLHVLEHVPGARQHPALAVQLCDATDHLQRAAHLDVDAAVVPA